jgi:hypothetical protein
MSKEPMILLVASEVQARLMREIFIPEIIDGFWTSQRPAGHQDVWRSVEVRVAGLDGRLGTIGFDAPRTYNFGNPEFFNPCEEQILAVAKAARPTSCLPSIKKELIELGHIIGGRKLHIDQEPTVLYRGNHREGTVTYSSAKARTAAGHSRASGQSLKTKPAEAVATAPRVMPAPSGARRPTAVKKAAPAPAADGTRQTSSGGTVRWVPAGLPGSSSTAPGPQ